MAEPKPLVQRKKAPTEEPTTEWWDTRGLTHPMDDGQFVRAFCDYILTTTDDHSLRVVRDRAYRFIRNWMAPQLEAELTRYRKTHS